MRLGRAGEAQQTINHAVSYLGALADQGQQTITIRKAMELLGVTWRDPAPDRPAQPPGTDPLTGCAPVIPQTGPERVQAAVERARGGPAPVQPQGYA
jgi:hypothetical protein